MYVIKKNGNYKYISSIPIQLLLQKLMLKSLPNLYNMHFPNQLLSSPHLSNEILKSLHQIEYFLMISDHKESRTNPLMSPYFKVKRENQLESLEERIFHAHFLSSALLKALQSLTPMPPLNFGLKLWTKILSLFFYDFLNHSKGKLARY